MTSTFFYDSFGNESSHVQRPDVLDRVPPDGLDLTVGAAAVRSSWRRCRQFEVSVLCRKRRKASDRCARCCLPQVEGADLCLSAVHHKRENLQSKLGLKVVNKSTPDLPIESAAGSHAVDRTRYISP